MKLRVVRGLSCGLGLRVRRKSFLPPVGQGTVPLRGSPGSGMATRRPVRPAKGFCLSGSPGSRPVLSSKPEMAVPLVPTDSIVENRRPRETQEFNRIRKSHQLPRKTCRCLLFF